MTQETALEILKMGQNVFLTGPAGSGKTFVLNRYIEYLKQQGLEVAVTASTGIAATHMNGQTIHAWSGIGIRESLTWQEAKELAADGELHARYRRTKVLIIDEISMLDADRLDAVEQVCRATKDPFLPFGGLQVVLCGDFFQLPPVSKGKQHVRFAFEGAAWQAMHLKVCYLEEQYRHEDDRLKRLLNAIRSGMVNDETYAILEERVRALQSETVSSGDVAKLYTHNADVDILNDLRLHRIEGQAYAYTMKAWGKRKLVETLKKNCLAPERLVLKVGAQVMFVKNNFENGYVNGTLGHVIGFEEKTKLPVVKTFSGREVSVTATEWQLIDREEVAASIEQLPLRLAWAVTVHKSQGMSLDAAEIDLRKSFEYGMGYVALSRVRRLSGLYIRGFNAQALQVHPTVRARDQGLREESHQVRVEFSTLPEDKRQRQQVAFAGPIQKGNRYSTRKDTETNHSAIKKLRKKRSHAYRTWSDDEDKKLKREYGIGKTNAVLALMFLRTEGAIRARLKKLGLKE